MERPAAWLTPLSSRPGLKRAPTAPWRERAPAGGAHDGERRGASCTLGAYVDTLLRSVLRWRFARVDRRGRSRRSRGVLLNRGAPSPVRDRVRTLVKARQHLAELREEVATAERDDVRLYAAAIAGGWSTDELRKIGLAEPEKKARVRRRAAARRTQTSDTPQVTTPLSERETQPVG